MTKSMKLFYSPTSPYVRKVMIVIHELGLLDKVELIPQALNPTKTEGLDTVSQYNPLAKIPTLHVPGLGSLYGSQVINQYLFSLKPEKAAEFLPEGPRRFTVLTREALADGALDALLLIRYETFLRPENLRWDDWQAGQLAKVSRAFDELERIQSLSSEDAFDYGNIVALCALGYASFRFGHWNWRETRPSLSAWYDRTLATRESAASTVHS
ncbi:hypothetical protein HDU79_007278 [Rhizoclosmatium sp. JEL0117]|nr:hypothetical protein HDU79_007278 [Rhizoclosmatium sp. JEL0117]